MSRNPDLRVGIIAMALLAASGIVDARQSDRNKPMDIEAGHQICGLGDDATCTFTGKTTITQGTLRIVSDKAVISQAGGEPSRAQFSGGVTLSQQMDDGTDLNANAANIDYNLRTEVVVFTGNVKIQQARGTLNGERVVYNMKTGQIESGGSGNGRVKMRIVPKSAQGGGSNG